MERTQKAIYIYDVWRSDILSVDLIQKINIYNRKGQKKLELRYKSAKYTVNTMLSCTFSTFHLFLENGTLHEKWNAPKKP